MNSLAVVTHRRWIADELAAGAPPYITVRHDNGLDVPRADAYWCPVEWMARARRAGVGRHMQSPGTTMLPMLRPDVESLTFGDLAARGTSPGPVFAKLAEVKDDRVLAQVWPDIEHFLAACATAGVHPGTFVHLTRRILNLRAEYRVFMMGTEPMTTAPYLVDGNTEDLVTDRALSGAAMAWARHQARLVVPHAPNGWVLDVGFTTDEEILTVEVNPAWSSAFYGCFIPAVLKVVVNSNLPGAWNWIPDPWLVHRAARMRELYVAPVAHE